MQNENDTTPLSLEHIFTTTRAFIAGQGKCVDAMGECRYRGHDGRRCAAGLWMTNYDPKHEGEGLTGRVFAGITPGGYSMAHGPESALDPRITVDGAFLLADMQEIHDFLPEDGFYENWMKRTAELGERLGLAVSR